MSVWVKGDLWGCSRTGSVQLVTMVRSDGVALLAMVHPYNLNRSYTQKPIPESWVNLGPVDWNNLEESIKKAVEKITKTST